MTITTDTISMSYELRVLLNILREHTGKQDAIRMAELYEQWSGDKLARDEHGKPIGDVATLSRTMRKLIDDLRDIYGVPVMSATNYGYWIVTTKGELELVRKQFISRGLKSLQTAARLAQNSLMDEITQLSLNLSSDDVNINPAPKYRLSMSAQSDDLMLSKEARLAVVSSHLTTMLKHPQEYIDQIHVLQTKFGYKLINREVLRQTAARLASAKSHVEGVLNDLSDLARHYSD